MDNEKMIRTDRGLDSSLWPGAEFSRIIASVPETIYSAKFGEGIEYVYISPAVADICGYLGEAFARGEVSWTGLIKETDLNRHLSALENCRKTGKRFSSCYRITDSEGKCRYILDRASPLFNDRSEVVGVDGIMRDITEQREAEKKLERTQMLQSIGRLCAGIAHEINTPIQFVSDNVSFLKDSLITLFELTELYDELLSGSDSAGRIKQAREDADFDFLREEVPSAIDQSLEGLSRVASLISAMRDFSHIDERRMSSVDLNKAIRSTLTICRNEIKYAAEVEINLDENLPRIICCLDDIHQVILNLLVNAAHSIEQKIGPNSEDKGTITVSTMLESGHAVLRVSDTGCGIRPEIQQRMFDAFFTTKKSGKGTGQGLSIIRSIVVDKHGGRVDFETEQDVGTTFIISLPVNGKSQQPQ